MIIGLLEDDLAIQEMLRLVLQSEGYEVTIYANAEECLNDLRVDDSQPGPFSPDLLIIDLRLPKSTSGTAVIEQIRRNPRLATLPVILMTAATLSDLRDLERLRVRLLTKPFDIDEVIAVVGGLIKQANNARNQQ